MPSKKTITKVVYKPKSKSTEEFSLIVDGTEYQKWKDGDTSIPLASVVESFEIMHSTQGSQGILGRASKQQLSEHFGSEREDEAVKKLLEIGTITHAGAVAGTGSGATNPANGSQAAQAH